MSFAAKIVDYHHEKGTAQLFRTGLLRIKEWFFDINKEIVACLPEIEKIVCAVSDIPFMIKKAEMVEIPELKRLTATYKRRDFSRWIQGEYLFFIARLDNKIVGYICVGRAKKTEHPVASSLKLQDTDYWGVDSYIHSEYRRKKIYQGLYAALVDQAKREGYKRGFGTLNYNNKASRRSHGNIGIKEIGTYTTLRIVGIGVHRLRKEKDYDDYFK